MSLQYEIATIKDLPRVVEIYNSTIASRMVTADTEPVTVSDRMSWFEAHHPDKRPLWMVKDTAQNVIGWVSFQSFYGRPAYNATVEVSIYLAPESRGKGYGKMILQHCLEVAPQYEIKTLLAFIFAHNVPSIKLFEHFGFTVWGDFPNIAELDGIERSLWILGKRIN